MTKTEPAIGWAEALGEHATNPSKPRSSGETVFALDEEWTLSTNENRIKAQFEKWMRSNALKAIRESELEEGPDTADKLRSVYEGDRAAGHYYWDGKYSRSARSDWPGLSYLLFLLLRRCHPDVTLEKAQQILRAAPQDCCVAIGWALGNQEAPEEKPGQSPQTNQKKMQTLDSD